MHRRANRLERSQHPRTLLAVNATHNILPIRAHLPVIAAKLFQGFPQSQSLCRQETPPILPPTENSAPTAPTVHVERPHVRTTFWAAIRLAFGVAILVYLWRSGAIHFRDFDKLLTHWPLSLAAVAVLFLDICLMAMRTSLLLRPQEMHLLSGSSGR